MSRWLLWAACAFATTAAAQQPVAALAGQDGVAAERARRDLLAQEVVPEDLLVALLKHPDGAVVERAASVLAARGLARDALANMVRERRDVFRWRFLSPLGNGDLIAVATDPGEDERVRWAAVFALEDRGLLDPGLLAQLLTDPEVAVRDAVGRVLVYERDVLAPELLTTLGTRAQARQGLLEALALKPRPEVRDVLRGWLSGTDLSPYERLCAWSALPAGDLGRAAALEVMAHARASDPRLQGVVFRLARRLPPAVADGLVETVHLQVRQGLPIEAALSLLEPMTEKGEERLLSLARTFDQQDRESLASWLVDRGSPAFGKHLAAALDGEVPLEDWLLRRVRGMLETPAQVERVRRVFLGAEQRQSRYLAFDILIAQGVYLPQMKDFVLEEGVATYSAQRLFQLGDRIPVADLVAIIEESRGAVRHRLLQAIPGVAVAAALEETLIGLAQDGNTRAVRDAAIHRIATFGGEGAVHTLWQALRARPERQARMAMYLIAKPRPFVQPLFLAELADEPERGADEGLAHGSVHDYCRLGLAMLGDRHLVDRTVARLESFAPLTLRTVRERVRPFLKASHHRQIAGYLRPGGAAAAEVRTELIAWLAEDHPDRQQILRRLWTEERDEEVRLAALQALLHGPDRGDLIASFCARLDQEQFGADLREIAYEILAALRPPLGRADLDLLARLALVAPLEDERRELQRAVRGDRGRGAHPLMAGVLDPLRRDRTCAPGPSFAAAARRALASPHLRYGSRSRLINILHQAAPFPQVAAGIAEPVAALLIALPDGGGEGRGLAQWILGRRDEAAGALEAAERRYREAARLLIRDPEARWSVRLWLGELDPAGGRDPFAALAARPDLVRGQRLLQEGKRVAALAALERAARLGAGDRGTVAEIERARREDGGR